jgi:uncharacterized Zn-binding protein involved in type VI secretion
MPSAARISDLCGGHGCFPTRANDQGSPDTFVNNRAQHRQYDHWTVHCCPNSGCHDSFLVTGSVSDFCNNLQKGRVGDPIACGSIIATGSADTDLGPSNGSSGGGPIDLVYYKYFRAGNARAGDPLLNIHRGPNAQPFG